MNIKIPRYTKIGLLVIITLLVLIWGINYLKGHNFFVPRNAYYVSYEKVDGLNVSSPVTINGFRVGQVTKIMLNKNISKGLIIEFIVDKEIKIPYNSTARLYGADIMGTKAIELMLAQSSRFHKPGDTLWSAIEADLKTSVNAYVLPIKKQAESLLASIDSVITAIRTVFDEQTKENLERSFASIKNAIENFESSSLTLDTLIKSERYKISRIFSNVEVISNNLKENNDEIANIFTNFSSITDTLAKSNVSGTFTKLNKSLSELNVILEKVKNGEGSLGMLIKNDSLYINIEKSTKDLDLLLKDIKENPKRYLKISVF